jgi:hypothetical protein
VGLGLLLGALTGIAAFFGATMNASFAVVGSASDNPVLFTLAVGVMLAWRVVEDFLMDAALDRYAAVLEEMLPARRRPRDRRAGVATAG